MNVTLKQYRQLLGTYLAPQRRRVLVLGLVMAADLVLQLALPRVVQTFIDSAIAGVALQTLMLIGVGYLFVSIAENFTWVGWQVHSAEHGLDRNESHSHRFDAALSETRHELSQRPHTRRDD